MCKRYGWSLPAVAVALLVLGTEALAAVVGEDPALLTGENVLDRVERRIVKEPEYTSEPKYALIVLSADAEAQV